MTDSKPERIPLTSMDVAEEKREEFKRCLGDAFPEVFAEGAIDFDKLKRVLGEWVEPGKERFGLTWPGKAECMKIIQQPSIGTLKPVREESINFDETENLFIEGDNLEVLKLLQKSYFGKIKMIYIDPPYNTGKDFIYPDKYAETLDTYLEYTGQKDSEGRTFATNTDTSGRFHTCWLNMMYPRLYLAKNLLSDDGVIFISIDDGEQTHLKMLCDEIFGPVNCLATFIWKRKAGGGDDSAHVAAEHEYILCYAKDEDCAQLGNIEHESPAMTAKYNKEENGRRYYLERLDKTSLTYNSSMDFEIECPDGSRVKPPQPDPNNPSTIWRWSETTVAERRDELVFQKEKGTGQWRIYTKTRESLEGVTPRSLLVEKEHGRNRDGTQELASLIGPKVFSNPKPTKLLSHLVRIGAPHSGDVVLDFFAGSGSLAHAVSIVNAEDSKHRPVISVQLPESTGREDFPNICAIARGRLSKLSEDGQGSLLESSDFGFKNFRLHSSNFRLWEGDAQKAENLGEQLSMHVDHIADESTAEDILYELLLKAGFPLTTSVKKLEMADKDVYSIQDGALLICLDKDITPGLIDALAEAEPLQVICLDEGFKGNDQLKANAVQTFKARAQAEESEIVFKTV